MKLLQLLIVAILALATIGIFFFVSKIKSRLARAIIYVILIIPLCLIEDYMPLEKFDLFIILFVLAVLIEKNFNLGKAKPTKQKK